MGKAINDPINKLKEIIQDCNINFLIGSGVSKPFLVTLGNIEKWLTELETKKLEDNQKKIITASIYKKYFDDVIVKNLDLLKDTKKSSKVLKETFNNYKDFIKTMNIIIMNRKSSILNKQINIFTTNIDIFIERAFEETRVEFNDGFNGRFNLIFNLNNLKKLSFRSSRQYDNISEQPVFNLMKLHGSLAWIKDEKDTESILFSPDLKLVETLKESASKLPNLIKINANDSINNLIKKSKRIKTTKKNMENIETFLQQYYKIPIVNPTKAKFRDTVLDRNYYELLRIYSNELEKENTILFAMGFSFADEHIRDITVRALNFNPTLVLYIFAHTKTTKEHIEKEISKSNLSNDNVKFLFPNKNNTKYDFKTINNKFFNELRKKIKEKSRSKNV